LAPSARTVTATLRVTGLATERCFTNDHRVLNRATWATRQAGRMLLGFLITLLVSAAATIALGADDTVERRSGLKISAKGCDRDAVRSSKTYVIRCFGLNWVSMMLLVLVPWSRRVWPLPFLTTLVHPADKDRRRRHKTSIDWVRRMMKHVRRSLRGRKPVLDVDRGFAGCHACAGMPLCITRRTPAAQQAWPQTVEGHTPMPLAGLDRVLGYPLGRCGSGLVWRPAQEAAVRTCRLRLRKSWNWSSCAGRLGSRLQRLDPTLGWRPNGSGRTAPSHAPPPSCWPCSRSSPWWPCDWPGWRDPRAGDRTVS
jgi:DDE superfamily endonuclease